MEKIKIFETKLDPVYNDYTGFEFYASGNQLNPKDKATIDKIASQFYDSPKIDFREVLKLSIGEVIMEGSLHPTAPRRKSLQGYQKEPVQPKYHEYQKTSYSSGNSTQMLSDKEDVSRDEERKAIELSANKDFYIGSLKQLMDMESFKNLEKQNDDITDIIKTLLKRIGRDEIKITANELVVTYLQVFVHNKALKKTPGIADLVRSIESILSDNQQ